MSKQRIYRGERLKSAKEIQGLFSGKAASVGTYPFRLVYKAAEEERGNYPLQLAFSVPKRRFKKAVDRNRIKRLCREAFRLQKESLLANWPSDRPQYALMLLYVGQKEEKWGLMKRKMEKLLQLFSKALESSTNDSPSPPAL